MEVQFSHPPASQVFRQRLRETRQARGLSQLDVAERMTAAGHPLSKPAVLRIENGTREIKLDEALAFAQVLYIPFADLLEPDRDNLVAITDTAALDGDGMRRWLTTGEPIPMWPEQLRTPHDRALAAAYLNELGFEIVAAAYLGDKEAQQGANARFAATVERAESMGAHKSEVRQGPKPIVRTRNHRMILECGCEVPLRDGQQPTAEARCRRRGHGDQRVVQFISDPVYEGEDDAS